MAQREKSVKLVLNQQQIELIDATIARVGVADREGVVRYAEDDPIHLDADAHRTLAEAVAPLVRQLAP